MATKRRTSTGNKHGSKWIRPEKRLAIYLRDDMRCVYCQVDLANVLPEERGLDHVTCRSSGRVNNSERNLVMTCRSCNSARQDTPLVQFATPEAVARVRRQTRRALGKHKDKAKQMLASV